MTSSYHTEQTVASIVVNNGLQRIGVQASQATSGGGPTYSASRQIQVMAFDDNASGFAAAHTNLLSAGSIANEFDAAFDATPTRSGQTITHITTIPTGSGNFTIRRISLHDDTATNVTTTSTTLVSGVDGQSLTKTSDFTLAATLNHLHS